MGAITLIDELALTMPKLRRGVVKTLVEAGALQGKIPWITTKQLSVPMVYISGIPTVGLRFLNEAVSPQRAEFAQMTENLRIIDTDIDIDPVFLDNDNMVQNIQVAQTEAMVQSIAYLINDLIINADPTSDQRNPTGLIYNLEKNVRFNGQTVNASANTTKLECRVGTATDANYRSLLFLIDTLRKRLDNKASAFLVNEQAELMLSAGLRQLKLYDTTKDSYDREFTSYKGTPFLDMGFKPAGAVLGSPAATTTQGDQVMGNDSDSPTGNGSNAYTASTSIYAIRFGDNYMTGLQQAPMRVKPFGETDASPHLQRTNIRWVMHPTALFQKRAAGRIVGLDVT